jgi:L-lactate dehydrogenase complex protein LldF
LKRPVDAHSLDYRARAATILRELPGVRDSVMGAALHFDRNRAHAYDEIDADEWRRWAAAVKSHALTHLDRLLVQAESSLIANGVRVHWAPTATDACAVLGGIVRAAGVRRVVKGKSMLSEELGVNAHLQADGIEVLETDLGEYIIQLLDEPPSHILGPAIHRSLDDIRVLFHERFGTARDASPESLAAHARDRLRQAFLTADMGITGGNFIAADTGTIALIENEGNIRLSTSMPRIHVALVGIEKVVPRWSDLAHLVQLTARAATGQPIGTFVSLIQGPRDISELNDTSRRSGGRESDGPDQVHVIFVDNGRSRVLADPVVWEALRCVRCGACLNACPVYRQTGGHAYGWVYSGPIGAVLAPGLLGLENTHPLPFASTLCGACADVCPVRIDIPGLLLEWRRRAVAQGLTPDAETRAMSWFATLATRPSAFRAAGAMYRAAPTRLRDALPVLNDWKASHDSVKPGKRGFNTLWKRERQRDADVFGAASPVESAQTSSDAEPAKATVPGERRTDTVAMEPADSPAAPREGGRQSPSAGRRAFAAGSRGPASRPPTEASASDNSIVRAVSQALAGRTRVAHPGALPAAATAVPFAADDSRAPVDRFIERFTRSGGEVVRFGSGAEASAWAATLCAQFESCDVGLFVSEHLSPSMAGLPAAPPANAALGVSAALLAAADTGTLILDSRDGRATQLLPPTHLVWIRESAIFESLAAALAELEHRLPAAVGLHSGPSRSADIGRVLVTGVHGPGRVIAGIVA